MSNRSLLIAANWKMNSAPKSLETYKSHGNIDVIVFPTFLDLIPCINAGIVTGGQFGRPENTGAFTGDISMKMLKDIGCTSVLCGHSDRRQFHFESNEFVAEQAAAALQQELHPIVCVGENEAEHDAGRGKEIVESQVRAVLKSIGAAAITFAYEPIWAISRGDPNKPAATSADAEGMHAFIRSLLPSSHAERTRILYGGSMKATNCEELLRQPNIDGGLIGGASLDPVQFGIIVNTATAIIK
ncbi:MAG TPA: triose-phosphate isomerase [Candidatus Peribacterales bacterium]|nr:triose-phosphate isomerase [Candidatus Peribacterales bacterium]